MKRWPIPFFAVLLTLSLTPTALGQQDLGQQDFGPEEWHQYRLHSDKNAVFDNDSEPLEYREFETANEVRATPTFADNKMFIGNHESGELLAFDVHTGEELWRNAAPNWIHSEMIQHAGTVYVGFGNRYPRDNDVRGTGENGVLALDAETGEIDWKYNTEGEVMPTPAYREGFVYITTGDHDLYKLDSETGDLEHREELGHTVSMSAPNITEDRLYVGGGKPEPYTFSAYDLQQDDLEWQREFPDVFAGLDDVPPAVSDDLAVTTALKGDDTDPEHLVYAMDTETGEIVWEDTLGTGEMVGNNKSGAPTIHDGTVYVGSPITETFYAYDLTTGEQLWSFADEVIKAPPVVQDGVVYFSNAEGVVHALDTGTGEAIGQKELSGTLAPAGPVIMNDTLFVGSQDTNVYAVPLAEILSDQQGIGIRILWYAAASLVVIVATLSVFVLVRRRNSRAGTSPQQPE